MLLCKSDKNALLFYACAASCIALLALLSGCGEKRLPEPTVITGPSGTVYELPVVQVPVATFPADPGKDAEDIVAVIVVPPSDSPTTVRVYDKPKKAVKRAREAITGTKGSPDVAVVSDNPGVLVTSDKKRGLWPWIVGAFTTLAGLLAARKWLARFGWFARIFGRFL